MAPTLPKLSIDALESLTERMNLPPTQTLKQVSSALLRRQSAPTATVTVVSNDSGGSGGGASTLSGGAIAGIVIGSIAGFLLLWWIFRSCTNLGAPPSPARRDGGAWYDSDRSRYASPHRHHHHRSRSHSHRRRSTSEVGHLRPVAVVSENVHHQRPPPVYVQESDSRNARRGRREQRSRNRY
jgi:hypothetical protein